MRLKRRGYLLKDIQHLGPHQLLTLILNVPNDINDLRKANSIQLNSGRIPALNGRSFRNYGCDRDGDI